MSILGCHITELALRNSSRRGVLAIGIAFAVAYPAPSPPRTWWRSCAASCCGTRGVEFLPHVAALAVFAVLMIWLSVRRVTKIAA
jgi:hypothetical protein